MKTAARMTAPKNCPRGCGKLVDIEDGSRLPDHIMMWCPFCHYGRYRRKAGAIRLQKFWITMRQLARDGRVDNPMRRHKRP